MFTIDENRVSDGAMGWLGGIDPKEWKEGHCCCCGASAVRNEGGGQWSILSRTKREGGKKDDR
jgi:hypothetical protein